MRQFHVPQFIEVEDKIFGPLTLKQFLYLIGGLGLSFLLYAFLRNFLPFFIIFTLATPILMFFAALAFYKVNGQPFMRILESALSHYTKARLYVWKKVERPITIIEEKENFSYQNNLAYPRKKTKTNNPSSKLRDLAWSIDIQQDHERTNINKK